MNCLTKIVADPKASDGRRANVAPVPEDFTQRAAKGTNADLKRLYGVGDKVLARWRREADLPSSKGRTMAITNGKLPVPNDFKDRASRLTNRLLAEHYGVGEKTVTRWRKESGCNAPIKAFNSAQLPKQHVPPIPSGEANEAAQFLRTTHRPVYHRIIEGKEFNGQYVVGTMLMSATEIVSYAAERGFRVMPAVFKSRFLD